MKKWENFSWSELKHVFTYSPIHLFTYSLPPPIRWFRRLEPKLRKNLYVHQNWAYAAKTKRLTANPKLSCCDADMLIYRQLSSWAATLVWYVLHFFGNKMQKWSTLFWSELKHLFTYSPIHFYGNVFEKRRRNSIWIFSLHIYPILT